jgi:hypothetical protein
MLLVQCLLFCCPVSVKSRVEATNNQQSEPRFKSRWNSRQTPMRLNPSSDSKSHFSPFLQNLRRHILSVTCWLCPKPNSSTPNYRRWAQKVNLCRSPSLCALSFELLEFQMLGGAWLLGEVQPHRTRWEGHRQTLLGWQGRYLSRDGVSARLSLVSLGRTDSVVVQRRQREPTP